MKKEESSSITKFSTFFVEKWRFTVILLLAIVALGTFAYTTLLKREGFPPIEFPISTVQVTYFGLKEKVMEDVTQPMEKILLSIDEINEFSTSTADNFTLAFIQYNEGVTSEEGSEIVQKALAELEGINNSVNVSYNVINPAARDRVNDLIFSVSGERKSIQELQLKATEITNEISKLSEVKSATPKYQLSSQINPMTGETMEMQTSFSRVGYVEGEEFIFTESVDIGVRISENAGIVDLSDAVRGEIQKLEDNGSLEGYVVTYNGDSAVELETKIMGLESNIIQGLIAIVVVLFLLVNFRSALVTAAFVPIVFAGTFLSLYLIGLTLNTITLFALILVLGLFVDDAIVVVESIDYYKKEGYKGLKAVKLAINDIGRADLSGTLTTILVFSPLLFVSGVLGEFIREIPLTVIVALIVSLVVALSIIPLLANVLIPNKKDDKNPTKKAFSSWALVIAERFSKAIRKSVDNKISLAFNIAFSILVIGIGVYFANILTFSVFPEPKDAELLVLDVSFPMGSDINSSKQITEKIEKILIDNSSGEISKVGSYNGSARGLTFDIVLTSVNDREETIYEISDAITNELDLLEEKGGKFELTVQNGAAPVPPYQFYVQIYGNDENTIYQLSGDIVDYLNSVGLAEDVDTEVLEVVVDNKAMIKKVNGERFIEIKAKLSDSSDTAKVLAMTENVENKFNSVKLEEIGLASDSLTFDLGQESDNLDSFKGTVFALIAALIVMYILLVFLFDSFVQPLLIFLAIPFTFPGLFPGLWLTDNSMSFFVMIGIIGLSGIVVNNTIMLIEIANQRKEQGMTANEAIEEAIKLRFRPLLTTSVTTIAGLLPLALLDPFWESLALTIIFGLISSLILVLFVFPSYYVVVENMGLWFKKLMKKN